LMKRLFSTALVLGGTLAGTDMPTIAGPCTKMIARFEMTVRQSADIPGSGPMAAQSIGAQLGHQPTPSSVAQADAKADGAFDAALMRARTLDAKGKRKCVQALHEAMTLYNLK